MTAHATGAARANTPAESGVSLCACDPSLGAALVEIHRRLARPHVVISAAARAAMEIAQRVVHVVSAVLVTARADGSLRARHVVRPADGSGDAAIARALAEASSSRPTLASCGARGASAFTEWVALRPPPSPSPAFVLLLVGVVDATTRQLEFLDGLGDALSCVSIRRRASRARAAQARDRVLHSVAHDLKNPLSVIQLAAAQLALALGEEDDDVAMIHRAVARAERLIGDILEEARVHAGRLSLTIAPCSVATPIDDAVRLGRQVAAAKNISVTTVMPADLPLVLADPQRVVQIMSNLLGNAIKFTPRGGRVRIFAKVHARSVEVVVEDDGVGISAEDLRMIFRPFTRARGTSEPGTGLGLTIARDLVRAQGGHIRVSSKVGVGSQFAFTLPRAEGVEDATT